MILHLCTDNDEMIHYTDRQQTYRVEAVVDEMLQVLAHSDLSHQLVLVPVHASQLTHVSKDVLQSICQLQSRDKKSTFKMTPKSMSTSYNRTNTVSKMKQSQHSRAQSETFLMNH